MLQSREMHIGGRIGDHRRLGTEPDIDLLWVAQNSSSDRYLPLHPLHSPTADAHQSGNLEYAMPGAKVLADGLLNFTTN